jgi:hypothetical protein
METFSPPPLVDTVAGLLPPPLDEAPAAFEDQRTEECASENETNSHDAAFETLLSRQSWARGASGKADLPEFVREAIAREQLHRPEAFIVRVALHRPRCSFADSGATLHRGR